MSEQRRGHMSGKQKRFPDSEKGDIQILARPGASVWIGDRSATSPVEITETKITIPNTTASNIILNGTDIRQRINHMSMTPGVGESNVRATHIALESINTEKIGGILEPDVGGTGRPDILSGRIAIASSTGYIEGVSKLKLSLEDGGLVVDGDVRLTGGGVLGKAGELMTEGEETGRSLLRLANGVAPTIASATLDGSSLRWTSTDADGDLRRVMVKYSPYALTKEQVNAAPDDWFEVDEGGVHQIYVGNGNGSAPFYAFFRDKHGTFPLLRGSGDAMVVHAGRSYRFQRTAAFASGHPFWIGTSASTEFTDFAIEGSPGKSYTTGIDTAGEYIQFDIPADWSGTLNYYCTNHVGMLRAFDVRVSSPVFDRDPIPILNGSFDTSGQTSSTARLVSEDASGNLSDVFSVTIP